MRLDLLTGVRQLRRAPGTAAAAVLTLAIGIGATTAVFSFVTAVMSRGVAGARHGPARRRSGRTIAARPRPRASCRQRDFLEWSARARSFDAYRGVARASFNVSGAGDADRAQSAQLVTPGYFAIFGWRPAMGRPFTAEDARPGAPRVVVLSYAFWQNTLGGRADVVGQTIALDGERRDDRRRAAAHARRSPAFFVPLAARRRARRSQRAHAVRVGAAARAASRSTAPAPRWNASAQALEREFPRDQSRLGGQHAAAAGGVRRSAGASGLCAARRARSLAVLLIGCVNIANLLLARGAARRGELPSGWRSAPAAGASFANCWSSARCSRCLAARCRSRFRAGRYQILMTLGRSTRHGSRTAGSNPRALLLTAARALVATVVAGLAPALAARRADLVVGLHATGRSAVARRDARRGCWSRRRSRWP